MINTPAEAFEHADSRPAKGGWAPGRYFRKCCHCGDLFIGDKRAVSCAPCAYAEEAVIVCATHGTDHEKNDD